MELVTGHQATPHITAEQVSRLLQGVTTMDDTTVYRLPIGNNCAVSVSSLNVSIDTGEIVLHGFHTTFEEGYTVTLDPTIDAAKSRIDKIVMEIIEDLTTGIQTANIEVVQGEESSSPVAPATPVVPTSPTEKFLAVGVIATVTVSNITIASSVDNTELYAGSYISEETFSKTVRNQSSDQYNTTKAYKVGDYVIHNDTLYKCITACSAGSWEANQNCFVTDTLTNAVTTLNSDLAQFIVVEDIVHPSVTVLSGSFDISFTVSKTGYNFIGIAGFSLEYRTQVYITGVYKTGTNAARMYGWNALSSSLTVSPRIFAIFIKA